MAKVILNIDDAMQKRIDALVALEMQYAPEGAKQSTAELLQLENVVAVAYLRGIEEMERRKQILDHTPFDRFLYSLQKIL